eukprot:TRINITY_DN727_c0_g1_i7.p4 TRINITY_DN727_c0_g1~~TRINITY_DN727_c0_g1_i7.p4  ORF type:complete len:139 (-),score=40.34 TRINITY_DN727_c0_g1_i7:1081-1497(-)
MFLVQVCIFLLKWNSSLGCFDLFDEREFECRPPRLGLGAKLPPSKAAASADPVEKKLRAKLDAGKKRAAKDLEELNASDKNGEHSGDDEDGLESRANAFVKKRPMVPATTLQVKKKGFCMCAVKRVRRDLGSCVEIVG